MHRKTRDLTGRIWHGRKEDLLSLQKGLEPEQRSDLGAGSSRGGFSTTMSSFASFSQKSKSRETDMTSLAGVREGTLTDSPCRVDLVQKAESRWLLSLREGDGLGSRSRRSPLPHMFPEQRGTRSRDFHLAVQFVFCQGPRLFGVFTLRADLTECSLSVNHCLCKKWVF